MTKVDNEEVSVCAILGALIERKRVGDLYLSWVGSLDENVTEDFGIRV